VCRGRRRCQRPVGGGQRRSRHRPGIRPTLAAAAFAATLKDTVDLDSVREDLASVVRRVLELAPEP
jgi:hypothetical protein